MRQIEHENCPGRANGRSPLLVLAIFALIGFGIYFNSFNNSFHYDDEHHIVTNPYIRTLGNIPLFFTRANTFSIRPGVHAHYRPLLMVSYSLNYYFGNLNPPGFHIVNLAFHVGSAFLVFLVIRVMLHSFFISFAAGLLFLTTPYNSEVINYISARSTVMCAFFYLLAFYCWVKFREVAGSSKQVAGRKKEEVPSPATYYIASLLAFLLAMLTKEIAITLPIMLWLYDAYSIERPALLSWRRYLPYLPFLIAGAFVGFILRLIFFSGFMTRKGTQDMGIHFLTEVKVLAEYFYHIAIPARLSVEHQIQKTVNIYFFISLLFVVALLLIAYLLWQSRDQLWRRASFFIPWFFIVFLPTAVIPLSQPYQENRGYLAVVGLMGLAGVGIDKLRKNILKYSLIVVIVIIYAVGVVQRNRVWLNDYTLWSDVLKKDPASRQARIGIGNYYSARGQLDQAEAEYLAHLQIDPGNPRALTNLGMLYLKKGDAERAEGFFKRSLEDNPYQEIANYQMAKILQARGELLSASTHLLQILDVSPDNLPVAALLIDLYERMGGLDEAYERVRMAEEGDPNNPAVKRALGLIYMKRGQWEAAARSYEMVLKRIPDDSKTLLDLGYVYSMMGLTDLAEGRFKEALSKNPKDPVVYRDLGIIYQNQGRYDDALKMYEFLLRISPKSFRVYNNIGLAYFAKGENEKAIEAFQKALNQIPSYHIARINLARVYEEDGRKDLAMREYQILLKSISPDGENKPVYLTAKSRLAALENKK